MATTSTEYIDFSTDNYLVRQQRVVEIISAILMDGALSGDDQGRAIAKAGHAHDCGTLELRMLHMFAISAVQQAVHARTEAPVAEVN